MADIDKRVRTLWSAMSQDGKYSGSVESFNDQFFQSGKRGYEFRYGIYKQFKDAGADVGKDYHDFSKRFGLHATSPKASSGSIYDRVNKRINDARQTVAGVDPTSGAVPVANAVKAMQDDRPMTDAERRQMMQSADNIIGSTDLMKQQWENQGKYREQRTGLKTKTPVLGQNQNVVEQKEYNPETGKIEDTYLTSEGNVYANRFEADREQDAMDDFMDRQLNPIEAELRDAYAERDRLEEMMKNRNQELGATAYGTYYGGAAGMNATEDKEWEQLSAAYNKNKALITTLEDKRNNAMNDYFHTLGNEITNGYNFTLGLADAIDSNAIAQAQKHIDSINKKRENGEKLTHEEEVAEAVLKNMAWDNDVQARYGDEYGIWADAAKMTATSADLMAEFLLTGGMPLSLARSVMNGVVKGGVKLLGKGATKGLGKYMLKTTGATLGSMVAGAEMANTVGAGRTANDIVKRYTGDVLTDENGNYVLGHYDENNNIVAGGDTLLDAVLSAERQGISEYGSEVAGGLFPNGGKLLTKGLEKIGLDKLSKFLTTVSGKEWYKAYSKALETLGFNGVAGEGLEEYAGTAFDAMMGGDEWKNLADPKTHINIWLGCLTMSAFMNAPRATATAYQYGRYKAATNKSDKVAERQLGEEWQNIRSRIDATKNEDMANVVYDILNNNELAKEQKTAVMDYIKNLQQLRGFTLGEAAVERGGEEKAPEEQSVDQSYTQGYNAESNEDKQDVKNDLDDKADALSQFADESTLNALDEDGIGTLKEIMARDDWSDEQKQAALDYVNAKATYEGMIDRVKDDIETEVADSDAAIDRRVASQEQGGDGMIHPATMAKDNRQVDIISGNVVMSDDGTMVDTQKSDKDIIVRDRQTGKVEFANPKEIKSVEAPIDAEQLKASERERITNERAQAASNAIDGVLPMQQGDQYTLTYNGEQHQVQVVQDNGDGTVSVIIDGAKEPQDMAKEQLQDLANQSNRARLEQSRQQAQQQAPVEETPTETTAETPTATTAEIQEATPEQAPTEAAPEEAPKLEGNGLRKDMPMREDGNPAFMEVTPERTQQFLYGEESGMTEDEATQFVDKNIAAAEKALDEVKKGAPEVGTDFAKFKAEKAAYQQQLDAAQAAVDYWNNVKAARQAAMAAPVAQQAPMEQNAPEAVQPSEVESNATPIETTQETAPEASVESAEEKPTTRLKGSGLKSEEQIAEEQKKKEEQKAAEQKKEEEKKAKRQEKFRKRAESWSKKTGVKVNIIDNVDDVENAEAKAAIKKGRKVKGWWQQSNNEIYIYLPNMESMDDVDETFIHEAVAHRGLRHLLGEEEYGRLCDKVFDAMSPKAKARELKYVGVSEKDIKEGKYTDKQKRAAADEFMAKMSEHTDLNPTLWEQICNWIREALGRTIDVDKVKMSNESIQRLIRASYAHYQAEAKKAAAENLEGQGMAVDTERGDVRFAVADVLKDDDIEKVTKELMDVTGRSESTVKKWLKAEQSLAKIILDNDNVAFLDLQVDESVPSIWNNADYPQGTVEFSNICRKRLPLTMIYQKLQKEFPNLVFDAKTLESIRGILKENGVDVACGLCFVEDRRQLLGEIGKGFIDTLKGEKITENDNQNKALKKLRESGDEYVPNLYELLTLDGMKKLRREHPSVAQAFIEYNNARGMQAGRLFQAYSAYHREILKYNKAKVRSINNNGGLRIFSFSDFEAHHLIDLVQVLTDCAAKGIKVQGYTKVPEFANAVKDTGMKLNRSLIAKGKGYVDEDYVPADNEAVSPNVINGKRLLLDCVEGIDVNHPDFFDSTDNKNVGNILVGINDEQIHMAMEDPFVDYIIPFHTGLSKDILKQKNIGEWVNYKLMQLEKVDNGRGGLTNAPHHGINIYTDVLPRGEELIGHPIKNVRDFQMAFFKACEEKGYVPRFEKFINRGKNGEYVYTKGYEKLLLDFKLFDKNGKIVPQEAVVPIFDDKVNKRILEDYVKGEKEKAPNDELYDKVKEGLGLDGGVRFREDEERKIQGLENYTEQEIKDIVLSEVQSKLAENEIYDVDIKDIAIHGSRGRGTAREDSDLDVVVEYDGNWKEDTLFNILNDEPIFIEGIQVDVNPITKWKSGTMTEYMKRSDAYDREILEAKENGDEVRFREGDTFYSPAERAVENIKQEKATGEQWLKMIEKNGGLKKEEDKWMGLSDFLKGKKSLTKQEVLDFIRENQVEVQDVEYGDVDYDAVFADYKREYKQYYDEAVAEGADEAQAETQAWEKMLDSHGDDFSLGFYANGDELGWEEGNDYVTYEAEQNGTPTPINDTRLEYTTNGLENKKEIALVVPTIESWNEDDKIHFGDAGEGRAVAWIRFGETEGVPNDVDADRYHDYSRKMKEAISRRDEMVEQLKRYKGGMLTETQKRLEEEEAYIQQLRERYKDVADVKPFRVLVIDEIQSKRHQEGRERGYKGMEVKRLEQEREKALENKASYAKQLRDKYGDNYLQKEWEKEETDKFNALQSEIDTANENLNKYEEENGYSYDKIPDAPFQKNWHELAMKRMLRYAAENGYDKVAWTKGEQQADRYSLAKTIPSITRQDTKKAADKGIKVFAMDINGEPEKIFVDNDGTITNTTLFMDEVSGKPLSDFVGKDIAIRMMSMNDGETIDTSKEKVGGEGMKGFYDMMLPRFMDKYGKKWGVKTGEVELPNVEEAGRTMWSVDVTPEMKDSVMEGQTMFRVADDITPEEAEEASTQFRVVDDPKEIERLEKGKKVKVYRAMQLRDGKLYPPMAGKINGQWQNPIELGTWEQAVEHPELIDENGKFNLVKGNGASPMPVAYNPYIHTSRSPLNDQFASAWSRPELVTVEVEIPESELTSGYKADKAKDAVGEIDWKSGVVSKQLAKVGKPRKVILSRYDKPIRIVSDEEIAQRIAEMLKGTDIEIPFNTVTTSLREELVKQGVKIGEPEKGNAGKASRKAYDEWNDGEVRFSADDGSREERKRVNREIDTAISFVTGKDIKTVGKERKEREDERKRQAKEIYEKVLSGQFNDVTLRQIDNYINDVTIQNPYGRRLSQRLPQAVERALYASKRASKVDALFSRISESAVGKNERTRPSGRRAIEEKKKEILTAWAKATGNWHTDISEFTDEDTPIGYGTDSDVYISKDGKNVIKLSKGKPYDKRFRPDIDNIPLFNYVFPNSAYRILGYGDFGKGFVRIIEQPVVNFETSVPLTPEERTSFMEGLGFHPINKERTAFSNDYIIAADLKKSNILKDVDGNIRVIDADMKLHTKDVGGKYEYPPVEEDTNTRFRITPEEDAEYMDAVENGDMDKAQQMVDKVAEDAGYVIRGEHGTTHKFTIFNYDFANIENSFGKGHYFTNNEDDAEKNYASGEGADLTNRIENMVEQMEWQDGYEDMSYEERKEEARKILSGGENIVISAALKMKNPVVFGYDPEEKYKETFFDLNEPYDEESDEYGEPQGMLVDFVDALNEELYSGDYYDAQRVDVNELYDGSDGYTADQLKKKCDELLQYVTDEEGNMASNEIFKNALKRMGFDGIIDNAPSLRFNNMGLDRDTKHFIVFDSNQIKQTDPVTYDDNGKPIPLSERFNEENDDIRFRVSDERRRREYAERQWKRAHNKAANTIKSLGISENVTVVDTPEELAGYDTMTEQQKASKGWYDENTGNIVVVVGNHTSPEDVQRTILREGVARYGLRQLFGQNYNNFLDNVLTNAETDIRREIVNIATRNGYDFRKATEEYLAKLANDTDFERAMKQGWWSQIKSYFLDMLHSIGLADWIEDDLSDNELRYMLWRSYMNLTEPNARRNPFNRAREISMRDSLKVGDYSNIEDELPVGNFDYVAEQRIRKLVSEMPMSEVRKAYERINEKMRDEDGLDIDEHMEKVREDWRNEHGSDGIGKVMADDVQMLRDKYGDGLLTLRNYLRDRIENEGDVRFREDEDEVENTEENTEGGENSEENEEPLEAIDYNAGDMTLEEAATNALIRLAKQNERNLSLRIRAMHSIGGNLTKLRRAMAQQRKYDRKTVDSIVRLARMLMNTGDLNNFTRGEVKKLMSMVNRAAGKEDITKQADAVVDMMINHQLKAMEEMLHKQMKVKGSKLNQKGVEVQGALDITGQRTLAAFKDGIKIDYDTLQQRIEAAAEKMTSDNQVEADNARAEWTGYLLAERYHESILVSETEESNLRQELKQAKEDLDAGRMTREAYNEFVKTTQNAIRENRLERIKSYEDMLDNLTGNLREAVARAKEWQEKEQQRVEEIHHNANSDLMGVPDDEHSKPSWREKLANNSVLRFFMKPLANFDQILRFFGSKSVNGQGYLWNRFMGGFMKATDTEWRNLHAAHQRLDEKVSEVFGRDMRWSDLFAMERKMPTVEVEFWDGGEMKTHKLTQGNLLYIYMVNKMSDGQMKLRKMGITEDVMNEITERIDPRFKEIADWVQSEFLTEKRNEYNKVHERMFGASMASIDNYFPLKINSRSRFTDEEIGEASYTETRPSTITGSIVKRTRNSLALDITGADAFDVVLEHLQQMEHWAAFAEFSRDLNTLLSYRKFRNKVLNMSSARFGSGKTLWNNFKDACAVAAGVYQPKGNRDSVDSTLVNVAKGVTGAKISLRVYTALKQFLSYPAYFSEASVSELAKSSNPYGAYKAWQWAMENLPTFAQRWQSRQAGDQRLKETDLDWGWWKNKVVEKLSRMGMKPNAFVDAITVSMGAKAIYETKKKRYISDGYSEEQAHERALRDAAIAFNETQQSSENAFLSAMQLDRTATSVALTVFRNSSMGYNRRFFSALDNLKRKMRKGYREESIAFMQKQLMRDGLSEEQAARTAKRMYNRSWYEDITNTLIFGFVMQAAWNIAPYLPYLIGGDDDDLKEMMLEDTMLHALAGGVEGLTAGSVISDLYNKWRSDEDLSNYNFNLLPLMSDIQTTLNHYQYDKVAAANDVFNLLVQAGIGTNPQTLTDATVAILDACDGEPETSREAAMLIMRILQVPQSAIDNLYIDELGMSADKAQHLTISEMARRYAEYKRSKSKPLTGWISSDMQKMNEEDKYIKRFGKRIAERMAEMSDEDLQRNYDEFPEDRERRKMVGKEIAERMGGKDSYGNPQTAYGVVYAETRNYTDLAEDVLLQTEQKKAKQNGETEREKDINKARNRINKLKESLPETPFTLEDGTKVTKEDIMNEIRELRSEYLKEFGIKK